MSHSHAVIIRTHASKGSHITDPPPDASLARQYGGNSAAGWLGRLPSSWLPFVQLARLSPPAAVILIFFPHLFGLLHAGIVDHKGPVCLLQAALLLLVGSFFLSNTVHAWNDLVDAPLDALVERTRNRPIPRKAITPLAAALFALSQGAGAALCLAFVPWLGGSPYAALYALPGIASFLYYPYAKRHTYFPQLVLGLSLSWGIIMGSMAAGRAPSHVDWPTLCLYLASTLWVMIYDTIYAHQDLKDDIKADIKSLAVLFQGRTKAALSVLLAAMAGLLVACGWLSGMGVGFYILAAGGATASLALMIVQVDLNSTSSCWWWFSNGFWLAGNAIAAGLFVEYVFAQGQHVSP
ncbi:prenyltransferase, UbiA family protein [Bombardia bombarda]|uniref:Prenyltransferase, UbiA family protein n=1 Tax=Bombardia bombarda TaxID=252184 RepID=A0AA39XNA6_9PEZI|nr:prenyltransferase, UbiA family protein [Bombardia bombarda]